MPKYETKVVLKHHGKPDVIYAHKPPSVEAARAMLYTFYGTLGALAASSSLDPAAPEKLTIDASLAVDGKAINVKIGPIPATADEVADAAEAIKNALSLYDACKA